MQPAHHQAEAGGEYPNGCGNPVQWQLRKEDTQNTHQHGDCLFLLWHLLQHPEGLSPALNRKGTLKLKTDRNTPPHVFPVLFAPRDHNKVGLETVYYRNEWFRSWFGKE